MEVLLRIDFVAKPDALPDICTLSGDLTAVLNFVSASLYSRMTNPFLKIASLKAKSAALRYQIQGDGII